MVELIRPEIPTFRSSLTEESSFFYFNHIVDAEAATLTVEVIGPNLTMTFHHSRALTLLRPSAIRITLEKKTAGFLSHTKNGERHVIAWAESGHGCGRLSGDILDAPSGSGILSNQTWTLRAAAVGKLLGRNMTSIFDDPHAASDPQKWRQGIFLASHVEVKLAVHGICTLLQLFSITKDFDNIRRSHLKALKKARYDDGTRPSFEVYFSRKNCAKCGGFIRELQRVTGISIALRWHQRLTAMEYEKRAAGRRPAVRRTKVSRGTQETIVIEDEDTVDGSDDDLDDDEVAWIQTNSHGKVINIADDTITAADSDDQTISLLSPSPSPEAARDLPTNPTARYLHDMTYSIGQADTNPTAARSAVVGFARRMQTSRQYENIDKPLPATPVTEPPWGGAPEGGGEEQRGRLRDDEGVAAMLPTPSTGRATRRRTRSASPWDPEGGERCPVRERSPRPCPRIRQSTVLAGVGEEARRFVVVHHYQRTEELSKVEHSTNSNGMKINEQLRSQSKLAPKSQRHEAWADDEQEIPQRRTTPRARPVFSPEGSPF